MNPANNKIMNVQIKLSADKKPLLGGKKTKFVFIVIK